MKTNDILDLLACILPHWLCCLSARYSEICDNIKFPRPGLVFQVLQSNSNNICEDNQEMTQL